MGMTPERKKKLRTLLRKKAAEELKKEQERKAEERLRVIAERCGTKADLDAASMDDLKKICQQYFDKWYSLEGEMFFLQREVILRDLQINELTISVSDMRGKFIKPTLRRSPSCRRRQPNSPSPTSSRPARAKFHHLGRRAKHSARLARCFSNKKKTFLMGSLKNCGWKILN